jgi:carboxymethylenebutenolidase
MVATQAHTLSTADGEMRLYEALPDGDARGAVLVVQEAFGVNAHIEDVTRRAAAAGYHAVAPAYFHRVGGDATAEYGDMPAVMALYAGLDDAGVLVDTDAALDHLRAAGHTDARIGTVGFCWGGRITLLLAIERALGAAVGFYGGGIVRAGRFEAFPPLIDRVPELKTPWMGMFGDLDQQPSPEDAEALREAFATAPVDTAVHRYPGVGHGFHCDARDGYDEAAATDAWAKTLAWFEKHLG